MPGRKSWLKGQGISTELQTSSCVLVPAPADVGGNRDVEKAQVMPLFRHLRKQLLGI
jgi:hypothetical protein